MEDEDGENFQNSILPQGFCARVFHMEALFTTKRVKNSLAMYDPVTNQSSEKVLEELLPKIRDRKKNPAGPGSAHRRIPPPTARCPPFRTPGGGKVSAG